MEMEYSKRTPDPTMLRHRPQTWLQLTLLIGFIFCLFIGVGALVALFLVQTEQEAEPVTLPLTALPMTGITPQHALLRLAGDPPAALAYQALQAGELDLAYTMTFFAVELGHRDQLTLLLQLGRRYAALARNEPATQAFRQARTIVITSPGLTINERSQALLQIADGFQQLENGAEALDAAVQAKRLTEQTPDLLPAQRAQIFESLRLLANRLEDENFSNEIEALARNPYLTPNGASLISVWETLAQPLAEDPTVTDAAGLRQQAARALIERLNITGGIDYEPERQTLAAALIAEDQARSAAFQRTLAAGLSLPQQVYLLQQRLAWAALKLQIASGGFGLALVPEWEANRATLHQEAASAINNLLTVVEAIASSQVEPITQAMLRVESNLWLGRQVESGLAPDRTINDLSEQLRSSQQELIRLGASPALPVANEPQAVPPGLRILPFGALQ